MNANRKESELRRDVVAILSMTSCHESLPCRGVIIRVYSRLFAVETPSAGTRASRLRLTIPHSNESVSLTHLMKWTLYGPDSLLFQFADAVGDAAFAKGRAIIAELENRPPKGLTEFIPAFTTVLLEFDLGQAPDLKRIAQALADQLEVAAAVEMTPAAIKEIPVIYDGPDLGRVAQINGLSVSEIAELHSGPVYNVYALGFTPGFAYLGDLDPRLRAPRLASPRPRVQPGSVGIGGEHTGVYTVESPGGWNLIGRTPLKIFDPDRVKTGGPDEAMFLLRHGDRVKFVPRESEDG